MEKFIYNDAHINTWYISYKPQLIHAGLKFGFTAEEVKDIINQLFLDLIEKKVDPLSIQNPQAYISKSFKRRLIDYSRSCKRTSALYGSMQLNRFEPSIAEKLDIIQCDIELKNKIKKSYDKLPERCKKAIYLKYYRGMTTEQIAEVTGLSKRTVYNNLFEGIKLLRSAFVNKTDLSVIAITATLLVYFIDTHC